ncbi:expansin-A23-like [Pyrus x bretschneideri]|uniref:expansin-A23-like n=1 Tax=Pyrus x bretschneideri TaxID=225117 RepID=UPI0005115CD8|nr:expansin-A23-like [Pyrus x bretschneideri]
MAKLRKNLFTSAVLITLLVQAMGYIIPTDMRAGHGYIIPAGGSIGNGYVNPTGGRDGNVWQDAHATFYGDMNGGDTMQGACGYGNLHEQGYGLETAALSTALFNNGGTCGACFQLMCVNDPQWCNPHVRAITITATNFCPPNWVPAPDHWCNPPQKHFDLSMPMFAKLAQTKAGIIPVKYRRVSCQKRGGVKFELKGNPWWLTATVFNVGGAGDVTNVRIKGSSRNWIQMSRNWGQVWLATGNQLVGQSLSFLVTTSDGKTIELDNVAPANWQFGQTFEGRINF